MRALEQLEEQGIALTSRLDPSSTYLEVVAGVFELLSSIDCLERDGVPRQAIVEKLGAPRKMVRLSPFFARLQDWPRGYPGDFETIEYLMQSRNLAAEGSVAFQLERYGLTSPAAQQHRNKVRRQAELILEVCSRGARPAGRAPRILSLACGSSPDVASVQRWLPRDAHFTLLDGDADAVRYSRQRLTAIESRCHFVHGNVLRLGQLLAGADPFDLVLVGGLFDYLRGRSIARILKLLWTDFMAEGATLFFTNVSAENPDRIWIEYLADWILIARDERVLLGLCGEAGIAEEHCKHQRDATGSTILMEVERP